LAQKEADLEILTTRLANLIATKEQKEKESNQLKADLASLQSKIDRGEKLVAGLADEKTRWDQTVKELEFNIVNLIGDCLLAAAFMSYCGPFPSEFRNDLNKTWLKKIKEEELPYSKNFEFSEFLAGKALARQWQQDGLPTDDFST